MFFIYSKDSLKNTLDNIKKDENEFVKIRSLWLGDTHLENVKEQLSVLNEVYDFSMKKGISYINYIEDLGNGVYLLDMSFDSEGLIKEFSIDKIENDLENKKLVLKGPNKTK